jgi:signal transduction histidine kinase
VAIGRSRLEEAITLLALNAHEAMPAGGTVAMTTRRAEEAPVAGVEPAGDLGYVELVVSDTGPGIPPDVLPHVFEPFFTTKGPGHPGLGLTTVYGIARRAGGDARAEPARGGGATFILRLPAGRSQG